MDSGDDKAIDDLVQITKKAIREDGFLFIENYGVSLEQVGSPSTRRDSLPGFAAITLIDTQLHRQFALAQYLHRNISEEDQERLLFHPETSGKWAGYKHPWGFKVGVTASFGSQTVQCLSLSGADGPL
jgi:hypothetical protein